MIYYMPDRAKGGETTLLEYYDRILGRGMGLGIGIRSQVLA